MLFKRKPAALASDPTLIADGPEAAAAARPQREKLGWFEKRQRRRRRRIIFEEVLAWILVPAMIYLVYYVIQQAGGIPKELTDFANEVIATLMKGKS